MSRQYGELKDYLTNLKFAFAPVFDGRLQRFDRNGKVLSGWYAGKTLQSAGQPIEMLQFGDFATGEKYEWWSRKAVSPEEARELDEAGKEARKNYQEEKRQKQERAAIDCGKFWETLDERESPTAYTLRKGIYQSLGARRDASDNLFVPLTDADNVLWNLQQIGPSGIKRFWPGGKIQGNVFFLGGYPQEAPGVIYLAEGYSTGASIYEALRQGRSATLASQPALSNPLEGETPQPQRTGEADRGLHSTDIRSMAIGTTHNPPENCGVAQTPRQDRPGDPPVEPKARAPRQGGTPRTGSYRERCAQLLTALAAHDAKGRPDVRPGRGRAEGLGQSPSEERPEAGGHQGGSAGHERPSQGAIDCGHSRGGQDSGNPLPAEFPRGSDSKRQSFAVVCALNAGNLVHAATALAKRWPDARFVLCADDDRWTTKPTGESWNPGMEAAILAARAVDGRVVLPDFSHNGADLSHRPTDFNDLVMLPEGLSRAYECLTREFHPNLAQAELNAFYAASNNPQRDEHPQAAGNALDRPGDNAAKVEGNQGEGELDDGTTYDIALTLFRERFSYVMLGGSKMCFGWNGRQYYELTDASIRQFAQRHLLVKTGVMKKHREEFLDRVFISRLKDPEWFSATTHRMVNFQNGTLSLDTMELSPHSTNVGFRHTLGYEYRPAAKCPVFDAMLGRICVGDEALALCLLEYMGYALSNDTIWLHKALVLTGDGENGKSTFMNVLRGLAGSDNYCSLTLSDLKSEGNRQLLDGKLFNMAEETPSRSLTESSLFKNLVSGGETQVRQLYKRPYIMKNRAKIIFACNNLPGSQDTTRGFFRRFLIIPFNATFNDTSEGFDPFIEDKLKLEYPGIFNKAVKAYQEMQRRGRFTVSEASTAALEEYRMEVDSAAAWIQDSVVSHPPEEGEKSAIVAEIYSAYSSACNAANIDAINAISFGRKLAKQIPDYKIRVKVVKEQGRMARRLLGVTYSQDCKF